MVQLILGVALSMSALARAADPVVQVSGGGNYACSLHQSGKMYCWGRDSGTGARGTQGSSNQPTSVDLSGLPAPVQISAGNAHVCARWASGVVRCWGQNNTGQLGRGNTVGYGDSAGEPLSALAPIDLGPSASSSDVKSNGQFTCALLTDGAVKCWGENSYGQLGAGDRTARGARGGQMGRNLKPVDLGVSAARSIATGYFHACAILEDGSVKCWGLNGNGQLGVGDTNNRGDANGEMGQALPAVQFGTNRAVKKLALAAYSSCALFVDGSIKCWGRNESGELGIGAAMANASSPEALPFLDLEPGLRAIDVSCSWYHCCAVLDNAAVKCWGHGNQGQLGYEDTRSRGRLETDMGVHLPFVDLGPLESAVSVTAYSYSTCARLQDGNVKCWGYNGYGDLGVGDTNSRGNRPGSMGDALARIFAAR